MLKIFLIFTISLPNVLSEIPSQTEKGKLFLGKIPNNEFNLAEINGFYKPEDAIKTCEKSLKCAGFSYRGLKNSTIFRDKKYDVNFFYFIPEVQTGRLYRDFVSYYSRRTLGVFDGRFDGAKADFVSPKMWKQKPSKKKKKKKISLNLKLFEWVSPDVAAFVINPKSPHQFKSVLSSVNLHKFLPNEKSKSENVTTYLNFNAASERVLHSSKEIDLNCPQHDHNIKLSEWKLPDTLPRISCKNITPDEFTRDYIETRTPVMLTDCLDEWPGKGKWTDMKTMFRQYGKMKNWNTDVAWRTEDSPSLSVYGRKHLRYDVEQVKEGSLAIDTLDYDTGKARTNRNLERIDSGCEMNVDLKGTQVIDLMERNATIRVFDKVGIRPRRKHHTNFKPELIDDYSWPKSIPKDLMRSIFGGVEYKWVILSQGSTGSHVHHDPLLMDAWNALVVGHKAWVIFPKDVRADVFRCATQDKPMFASSWWSHVLPQLRKKRWYGKPIIEAVQKPGEVVYIPQDLGHAVLNLDENISVTENYLHASGFEDLTKYYAYGWNPLQYHTVAAAEQMWKNLVFKKVDGVTVEHRRYLMEMLKQVNFDKNPYSDCMKKCSSAQTVFETEEDLDKHLEACAKKCKPLKK